MPEAITRCWSRDKFSRLISTETFEILFAFFVRYAHHLVDFISRPLSLASGLSIGDTCTLSRDARA